MGEITDRQLQSALFEGIDPGIMVGQAGVEYQHNRLLMGRNGMRRVVVNSRGVEVDEAERVARWTVPWSTSPSTSTCRPRWKRPCAGQSGSVVALDPETGEMLGLVSNPAYDPNLFATGIEQRRWSGLIRDPQTPLVNRVIQGQYPAGSTFKIVTAMAALQEGVITPRTSHFCPGYLNVYGTMRRCHKAGGHGMVDLRQAIAGSCNVYFYHVGVKLEIDRIARYANLLGLGPAQRHRPAERDGRAHPQHRVEAARAEDGVVPGRDGLGRDRPGPGAGDAVQMARLAAVIANGGRLVKPHLLKSVRGVPEASPTIERIDLGLKPSVLAGRARGHDRGGRGGNGPPHEAGGHHGRRQDGLVAGGDPRPPRARQEPHELQPHGWFICFAPAENPKIAMAILVEHGRSGSESAVPVAARILSRIFKVPMPGAVPPDVPEEPPTPMEARAAQHARIVVPE